MCCMHTRLLSEGSHINLHRRPKQSLDPSIVSRFCSRLPTLNLLNILVPGSAS